MAEIVPAGAPSERPIDLGAVVQSLIAQHGNAEAALRVLTAENHRGRQRRRELKDRVAALEGQVPGDGTIVLTKDQAAAWSAYEAMKLTPEQIYAALTERDTATSQLAERDRERLIADAAAALRWKPVVLQSLAKDKGLALEMREVEVTVNGKAEKRRLPHVVTGQGAAATVELLTARVERDMELKEFLPALRLAPTDERSAAAGPGIEYPEQSGGEPAPSSDQLAQYLKRTYVAPWDEKPHGQPAGASAV